VHAYSVAGLVEGPSVFAHERVPAAHLHLVDHLVDDEPAITADPFESVAIVIVAFNAEHTIDAVLDRIPAPVAKNVGAILVSDDASGDRTAEVARIWAHRHPHVPVTVVQQPENLGYGGNQKYCYRWAVARGFAHAVMIHGDGQYAPEIVLSMAQPLLDGHAKVVFGSRMLAKGSARKGGMPRYKWVGNRMLTRFQNAVSGLRLSEWHTGYRAYSLDVLAPLDLESMSDGFDFDTEIILGLADTLADPRRDFVEIAIPTFYGDEKCHVNGIRYAADIVVDVMRHRQRRRQAASLA
jgi:glycosyltransferase involved in cell wall biosynthesis